MSRHSERKDAYYASLVPLNLSHDEFLYLIKEALYFADEATLDEIREALDVERAWL